MAKLLKSRSAKIGLPPGTPIHIGDIARKAGCRVITFDESSLRETDADPSSACPVPAPAPAITWIDIEGVADAPIVAKVAECFGIHPLVQEDILNTDQRPKVEDYGNYIYIVLKMLAPAGQAGDVLVEQVSLVVGERFLISCQEGIKEDVLDPLRERLRRGHSPARRHGSDFLAYSIIDAVVDNYFIILEQLADRLEELQDEIIYRPSKMSLRDLHYLKREMLFIRKAVWPLREVIASLERRESPLFHEGTMVYLRDLHDHTVQIMDTVETFRDMLSGMLDIYLSSISNRTNEVMKVLTIIATIFMPLTFIAGIYGMNFRYMPELEWHWGYFATLGFMAVIAFLMLVYFRKKKWL